MQIELFDAADSPLEGWDYVPNFISEAAEASLVETCNGYRSTPCATRSSLLGDEGSASAHSMTSTRNEW